MSLGFPPNLWFIYIRSYCMIMRQGQRISGEQIICIEKDRSETSEQCVPDSGTRFVRGRLWVWYLPLVPA